MLEYKNDPFNIEKCDFQSTILQGLKLLHLN